MTWFEASTRSEAVVTAERSAVWDVLVDPVAIAEMTPLVRAIDVSGDHWRWQMQTVPGLGVSLAPAFTVRLDLNEPHHIAFVHDPPEGERERAGVDGDYELAEHPRGTWLAIDLRARVDLPLGRIARPAVTATMRRVIASMGDGFSRALLERLGAEQVDG